MTPETPNTTTQAPQDPVTPQPQNDLAVGSMILGLISFTGFGALTGIPAIIMGIIALKRPGGRGFSITGIITGAITTAITLLVIGLFIFLVAFAATSSEYNSELERNSGPNQDTLVPGST